MKRSMPAIGLLALLLALAACASTKPVQNFTSGEEKNRLPFFEKSLLEEVHSITVPPFYGDRHGWRNSVLEVIASSERLHILPQENMAGVTSESNGTVSPGPEDLPDFLAGLGRSAGSDAVLNGIILESKDRHEIILQLIASRDARVLWWQAEEFAFTSSAPSPSDQEKMMAEMLNPLLAHLAKKEKPVIAETPPRCDGRSQGDAETKTEPLKGDTEPKPVTKPKAEKRLRKSPQPQPSTEDVNPM